MLRRRRKSQPLSSHTSKRAKCLSQPSPDERLPFVFANNAFDMSSRIGVDSSRQVSNQDVFINFLSTYNVKYGGYSCIVVFYILAGDSLPGNQYI